MSTLNASRDAISLLIANFVLAAYAQMWRNRVSKAVVPGTTVSLLSKPSKMPGHSFSIPAHEACPRAFGDICDDCYAEKGCYGWATTENAQAARFTWTRDCMRTDEGMDLWVRTMIAALLNEEYHRVHDSGDMFNVRYAKAWLRVCKALPATKFWIPTRAWQGGKSGLLPVFDPLLNVLRELAALPNVTVRPSALNFGDMPPVVAGLHAGSSADMNDPDQAFQCPARTLYNNTCGPCRHCWDTKEEPTNYPRH